MNKVHKENVNQIKQQRYMPDLELKPIHKFFRVTISSIKYTKKNKFRYNLFTRMQQFTIQTHISSRTSRILQQYNTTSYPKEERAFRLNNIFRLLDNCQSTILYEELSINNKTNNSKRKTPYFKTTFQFSKYTSEQ